MSSVDEFASRLAEAERLVAAMQARCGQLDQRVRVLESGGDELASRLDEERRKRAAAESLLELTSGRALLARSRRRTRVTTLDLLDRSPRAKAFARRLAGALTPVVPAVQRRSSHVAGRGGAVARERANS